MVTGGIMGIGGAVAEELLGLGAQVLVIARNADEVAQPVAEWTSCPPLAWSPASAPQPAERHSQKTPPQREWRTKPICDLLHTIPDKFVTKAAIYP